MKMFAHDVLFEVLICYPAY